MKHPLEHLIAQRIEEALENGDLSNLPNAGKPIADLDRPAEDILARVVKEQGGQPAFVALSGQLQALIQRLSETTDPLARKALEKQIASMRTRVAIEKERGA